MSLNSHQTTWSVIFAFAAVAIFSGASGAAILSVGGFHSHGCGDNDSARTQIHMFEEAIELYRLDVGLYPPAKEGLDSLRVPPSGATEKWLGPYIKSEVPQDPWGHPYEYHLAANGESFVVFSPGIDSVLGTKDDIYLPRDSGAP
jgi:general secretion pathway protein G